MPSSPCLNTSAVLSAPRSTVLQHRSQGCKQLQYGRSLCGTLQPRSYNHQLCLFHGNRCVSCFPRARQENGASEPCVWKPCFPSALRCQQGGEFTLKSISPNVQCSLALAQALKPFYPSLTSSLSKKITL